MVKKIIYYIIFFIFIFSLINYDIILGNFYSLFWNYLYNKWEFYHALIYHSNKLNTSKYKDYNIWNDNYKSWNYIEAINSYQKLNIKDDFDLLHNLWNSYYMIWSWAKSDDEKVIYFINSINFYKTALEIKYDQETKLNYYFVLNKLKIFQKPRIEQETKRKEKEKIQQKKQKEEDKKKQESEKKDNKQKNKEEEKKSKDNYKNKDIEKDKDKWDKKEENIIKQFRGNEYILWWSSKLPLLKSNEKLYVENYLHILNQQEKQNQQFFNKKSPFLLKNYNSTYDILNENFFDKTFNRWDEKDR